MPVNPQLAKANPDIMTVHEVAGYLQMSQSKIYRLLKRRQIPAIRIGKSWRFRKDLLDDWLSDCMKSGMSQEK